MLFFNSNEYSAIFVFFNRMEKWLLDYKSSKISYYRFGTGPKLVLCFHGYAEDATIYAFGEKYAGKQFTFYSIDLPFHGLTEWNEGLTFTPRDLRQIIEEILRFNKLKLHPGSGQASPLKLTLLGFSLGSRVALSLYQSMPEQIEKLVLLAPDGLKVNFWYWLVTRTWLGNKFFAFTMKHPGWFFGFLKMLNKLRLVNASIFKFVNHYIGNKDVRHLLYVRWTALRKFKPNLRRVKSFLENDQTPVHLVYGKHDRIIRSSTGEKFRKQIEKQCSLTIIDSGHQVLQEKHAGVILPLLLD
jgi:pimeloyl-ACP methyl ester carboxylesterase